MQNLVAIAESYEALAGHLNTERRLCKKLIHLYVNVHRGAAQAGRLAFDTLDQTRSFDKTTMAGFAMVWKRPIDDSNARMFWSFAVMPFLASRWPSHIKKEAYEFDFPRELTDASGRRLGRDGNPLRFHMITCTDGKSGRGQLLSEPATVVDSYDEADAMAHIRIQATNYADGCRLLARLIHDDAIEDSMVAELPLGPLETALITALGVRNAFDDAVRFTADKLADFAGYSADCSTARAAMKKLKDRGMLANTYRQDRIAGYYLTELGRQIFEHRRP